MKDTQVSKQQGRIQEYFKGGSKLWSERTAELFCGKLLTSHKKRPRVFQFANVGAGNFALRAVHMMVGKNNYFLIPLENFATDRIPGIQFSGKMQRAFH